MSKSPPPPPPGLDTDRCISRVILSEIYKATYSIGSKTNVLKSRRKKEDKRRAVENRKSRASVIFLSLAGTPVDGEYEPERYRVPQFNNVDLDVLGLLRLALRGDLLNLNSHWRS